MKRWHNILGEGGERLTILSLLPRVDAPPPADPVAVPLHELAARLGEMTSDDVVAVLTVTGGAVVSSDEETIAALTDQLGALASGDGSMVAEIRVLGADPGEGADLVDDLADVDAAIDRFVDLARQHERAVLSVVVRRAPTPDP
jgi:hypothetical protein